MAGKSKKLGNVGASLRPTASHYVAAWKLAQRLGVSGATLRVHRGGSIVTCDCVCVPVSLIDRLSNATTRIAAAARHELPRVAWHEATPEEIAAADVRKEQLRRELEAACAEST